jgi:nucleoside phosphorylase
MLRPRTIISAGIAGSFDPKNAWIGDIVLPVMVENSYFDKFYAKDAAPLPKIFAELHASREKTGAFTSAMRLAKTNENKIRGAHAVIGGLTKSALENAIAYAPHDGKQSERNRQFSALEEYLNSKYKIVAKAPRQPRVITKDARTFSWDTVFDSRELYEFLVDSKVISEDALCVEMESWGFLAATNLSRLHRDCEVLIVRAISDIVGCKGVTDDKVHDLEGECRKLAMTNVAKIVGQIIADKCR